MSDILLRTPTYGHTSVGCMQTLDAIKSNCQEQWLVGMDRKRESKESMLSAQLDDDDYIKSYYRAISGIMEKYFHV